jgi:CRISPR-associated protein Csd1
MMLGALVDYANCKVSGVESGFITKDIRWLAGVSPDGRFTGLVSLENTSKTSPDLGQPEMVGMPKALRAIGYKLEQAAHFLADTCTVVFKVPELDREGAIKKPEDHSKNLQKHETFKLLLHLASTDVPSLEPIHKALCDETQMLEFYQKLLEQTQKPGKEKLKVTDKISFFIDGQCILDTQDWRGWWRGFRARIFGKSATDTNNTSISSMVSLVTGESIEPAKTHPKIMKLGGSAFGFAFVTYDKEAFESYGLIQGENGAVDQPSATAYRAAIDSMLNGAKQLGEMKIALWFDKDIPPEDDFFLSLFEPNLEGTEQDALERAKSVLEAIRTGEKPRELANSRFNAIAMSGTVGRVMVRDWQTGSLEELVTAVAAWFEDLSIINARGSRNANLPGLNRLLMNIRRAYDPTKDESIDAYLKPVKILQIPFWRVALNPLMPIPMTALMKVMESHRAEVMTGKFEESLKSIKSDGASLGRIYARMGLIKTYHNRKGEHRMTPALDPNHPSKAYHCGRLMSLLAMVQEKALGDDINAGVVQRYYGAASTTPALVLGRLERLSQHHISKISRDSGGLAYWLKMQVAEVWNALGNDLPTTLTLEEQSLFALGYYQQFVFNRTKRSGNPEVKDETDPVVQPDSQTNLF